MAMPTVRVRTALWRGWRKRCPQCGQGALYAGWTRAAARCAVCGLVYERNQGDTWFFTIMGDRIAVAVMIGLLYFGIHRSRPIVFLGAFAGAIAFVILTAPNRWGVGTALHYLARIHLDDTDDATTPADAACGVKAGTDRPSSRE
jgi:uncharacterized protein (DUF983 family)